MSRRRRERRRGGAPVPGNGAAVRALALGLALLAPAAPAQDIDSINSGEYTPLARRPETPVFFHGKRITLTPAALVDGWVDNYQCHRNLPQVGALEIVFRERTTRALELMYAEEVAKAWVEGPTVQLEKVGPGAQVCLKSENRVLSDMGYGIHRLVAGPFFQRFLDGYFPMEVRLKIRYPAERLALWQIQPDDHGLVIDDKPGELTIEALFEGILEMEVFFEEKEEG